jgi:hypothetical protein
LKLCILVGMDCSFPISHCTSFLDPLFKSYEVLKISVEVWACSQPLPMQQILPKTTQIYPKKELWNTTKNLDFNIFPKTKISACRIGTRAFSTVWIFNTRIFYMLFILSKIGLCIWISADPLVEIDVFLKVPLFS